MNPAHVPPSDYGLYYNNTFMLHEERGVVEVLSSGGILNTRSIRRGGEWHEAEAEDLSCVWPANRAINLTRSAIYVARRPVRSARRSFTSEHYYIAWQFGTLTSNGLHRTTIDKLISPTEYPTLAKARSLLDTGSMSSVAISKDLILYPSKKEGYTVVCSGEVAGTLEPDTIGFIFTSEIEASPAAKRAAFKLQKEGFLCQ